MLASPKGRTCRSDLVEQMKFLARLETNGLSGSDGDFRTRARIASDAGFTRLYSEDAEAAKLNAFSTGEGLLHGFEDGVD